MLRSPYGVETIGSQEALAAIPLKPTDDGMLLVGDGVQISPAPRPAVRLGCNMRRRDADANIAHPDLGAIACQLTAAIERAGSCRRASKSLRSDSSAGTDATRVDHRPGVGDWVFLLLSATFSRCGWRRPRSDGPAVVAGVVLLWITEPLNIQSFIGAIMAIGVAMANAILLVTFAERRREGLGTLTAAAEGAASAAAILMTTRHDRRMLPMAWPWRSRTAERPAGSRDRGLLAATFATLFVLPASSHC